MGRFIREIRNKKYMLMSSEKDFMSARRTARDVHGAFGKKTFVPVSMSFNQVRKHSLADVHIRKTDKGYGVFASPKKGFWLPHVVIMERRR